MGSKYYAVYDLVVDGDIPSSHEPGMTWERAAWEGGGRRGMGLYNCFHRVYHTEICFHSGV